VSNTGKPQGNHHLAGHAGEVPDYPPSRRAL